MDWLDDIPMFPLAMAAVLLVLAPFPFGAEPHVLEKLRMLSDGTLAKPLDIFDLFLHATPTAVLALKLIRVQKLKAGS
jgi:hypothetical protein